MNETEIIRNEIEPHLKNTLIPFWKSLRDDEYGGYYGYVGYDLRTDRRSVKGCILNSRITWFFANAYLTLGDGALLDEARHAYVFLRDCCIDHENGGIYWSETYDGQPLDTTKHTYNQAFAIYALASYYDASRDPEALELAFALQRLIEEKCTDAFGYLEAFTRDFRPESNEKLSENGVMAEKTMNTLLHVFEAYTELYRVSGDAVVGERLRRILDLFAEKIYNPERKRQEVFFDTEYRSILDLHSYGHDIETSWLIDRGLDILGDEAYRDKLAPITDVLAEEVLRTAFDGHSLANECCRGETDETRVWWVQAEAVLGFRNYYRKHPERTEYRDAALAEWVFIRDHLIDPRPGSEWFHDIRRDGTPIAGLPIVEPWKCPYHNGRMCMEMIRSRAQDGRKRKT